MESKMQKKHTQHRNQGLETKISSKDQDIILKLKELTAWDLIINHEPTELRTLQENCQAYLHPTSQQLSEQLGIEPRVFMRVHPHEVQKVLVNVYLEVLCNNHPPSLTHIIWVTTSLEQRTPFPQINLYIMLNIDLKSRCKSS